YGHDGYLHGAGYLGESLGRDVLTGDVLGAGGKGRAGAEVVRARALGGERLLHIVRRDAYDAPRAEHGARLLAGHVVLADVHAVRAGQQRDVHVVVYHAAHVV